MLTRYWGDGYSRSYGFVPRKRDIFGRYSLDDHNPRKIRIFLYTFDMSGGRGGLGLKRFRGCSTPSHDRLKR